MCEAPTIIPTATGKVIADYNFEENHSEARYEGKLPIGEGYYREDAVLDLCNKLRELAVSIQKAWDTRNTVV